MTIEDLFRDPSLQQDARFFCGKRVPKHGAGGGNHAVADDVVRVLARGARECNDLASTIDRNHMHMIHYRASFLGHTLASYLYGSHSCDA